MTKNIAFPNLGIYLENVGKSFDVFGFELAYYGIIIGIGVIAGILLAAHLAKKTGQNPDHYYDLATFSIILSVFGARIYYVIFKWEYYKDNFWSIFNLREGGLAIYGGVLTAILCMYVFSKVKKLSFGQVLDTVAPCLLVGQIIGRWGNFFNREAFGEYTDSLLAMRLPLDAVRKMDVTTLMRERLEVIDGVEYIQVHPTFLYESIWNLGVLVIILLWRDTAKFYGETFLRYLLGYGLGRMWIEALRTDQLILFGTGLAVSQVLAIAMVLFAAIMIVVKRRKKIEEAVTEENSEEIVEEVVEEKTEEV